MSSVAREQHSLAALPGCDRDRYPANQVHLVEVDVKTASNYLYEVNAKYGVGAVVTPTARNSELLETYAGQALVRPRIVAGNTYSL